MIRIGIAVLSLALIAGCASSMQSVEVKGSDRDVVSLAGSWAGEFEGSGQRKGKITFNLSVGRHTAHAQVLMRTPGAESETQPLKVKYVRVDGAEVSGSIAAYIDPICKCTAMTRFTGNLVGDVIRGTYVTQMPTLKKERTGNWRVYRNRGS